MFTRILAILVAIGVCMPALAQTGGDIVPRIVGVPQTYGSIVPNENPTKIAPPVAPPNQNQGAPLFGQSWPQIGPQPAPSLAPPSRCPPGYIESPSSLGQGHMVVCVVLTENFGKSLTGRPIYGSGLSVATAINGMPTGQLPTALPPGPEGAAGGQCGLMGSNYYACGRGGTECCMATQDNPCFAGAFACSVPMNAPGPRHACCLSR